MAYSVQQFVAETRDQRPATGAAFEVEKNCFLQVNLGTAGGAGGILNQVWIKTGSMVAYQGDVKLEREGMMEHGFGNMLKKQFTGEGATLTKANTKGRAQLYLADCSKRVTVLFLQGESVVVNGDDLLSFEPTVTHKITMMKKVSIVSGGLYNVKLQGQGFVAILSHGQLLTLMVTPGFPPVFTEPQATVAWSGDLTPDLGLKTQRRDVPDGVRSFARPRLRCRAAPRGSLRVRLHLLVTDCPSTQLVTNLMNAYHQVRAHYLVLD